jgi:hypothetical protein
MGARARNLAKAWLLGALGFAALCAWIASILAAWHDGRYADMRLHLMDTEECLLHVPVLLCLWSLLFRGGYSASSVGGSVLAATVMERFYIIPKHLHDFLELNHYYPSFFYHGGPHVNAQYALTLCYVAVGVPFIASLVRRRTMDKTYMAVVGAVAVLTTVLFHLVVVELGLDNTMAEERKAKLDTMSVLAYAPQGLVEKGCRELQLACFFLAPGEDIPDPGADGPFTHDIWGWAQPTQRKIAEDADKSDQPNRPVIYAQARDIVVFGPRVGGQYVVLRTGDRHVRVLFDTAEYRDLINRHRVMYCTLGICAQVVWLLGSTLLVEMHRRRWLRRRAAA